MHIVAYIAKTHDVQGVRQQFWQTADTTASAAPADVVNSSPHLTDDDASSSFQSTRQQLSAVPPPMGYANVCGVMLPKASLSAADASANAQPSRTFVSTEASTAALHSAALAVQAAAPVMLLGPSGCGKSSLVAELAAATGNAGMLQLYMDDQVDARALLGAYVCAATPGEFSWQPGPLLQAVETGRWVLLDNLHLAPVEVVTLLEGLVATGALPVTPRGDTVAAHANFRLFVTVQTPERGSGASGGGATGAPAATPFSAGPLSTLSRQPWWDVWLPAARRADRAAVLSARFPAAAPLVAPAMALAEVVHYAQTPAGGHAGDRAGEIQMLPATDGDEADAQWRAWVQAARSCAASAGIAPGQRMLTLGKDLGMHDFVKMLQRLEALHSGTLAQGTAQLQRPQASGAVALQPAEVLQLSPEARTALLVEALDVMCGFAVGQVRVGFALKSARPLRLACLVVLVAMLSSRAYLRGGQTRLSNACHKTDDQKYPRRDTHVCSREQQGGDAKPNTFLTPLVRGASKPR